MERDEAFWEGIYSEGAQLNRYPFDFVVSFVFNNYPREKKRAEIEILEVGCGAGNNLWFCAREGFSVTGLDSSQSAIEYAQKRFDEECLSGKFIEGGFEQIQHMERTFDIVIDRAALSCVPFHLARTHINSIKEILLPEGKFLFTPYSDRHGMCVSGEFREDGLSINMKRGISNMTSIYGWSKKEIYHALKNGFNIESIKHIEISEEITPDYYVHAEWHVIATKQ
ncbi:MAG: class I SAM-dependent methyltransferase [Euryarchaeota archaeon]|nr:class I SAM-dependent methyltransferase [Euryarchaeota archaeon]